MKLSKKFGILKKLYFLGTIDPEELDSCNDTMITIIKQEMQQEIKKNGEAVYHIQLGKLLADNNISSLEEQ